MPFAITLVIVSAVYAVWQYLGGGQGSVATWASAAVPSPTPTVAKHSELSASPQATPGTTRQPAPTAPQPVVALKPAKAGQYTDGTYTGAAADAYYGTVQVAATIQDGKITDVKFLQYPDDRSTSRFVNSQAMPTLIQEAIVIQNAEVDGASGATFTSGAFKESLASALAQAKR